MSSGAIALMVRGVRHRYRTQVALDAVDLTVHCGECVALLGPNGAGKTTLIGLATGLLAVQTGAVAVGDAAPRLASPNATAAILHAVLIPSAVASGLWLPAELLPGPVQAVTPFLPTYHLAELARAQLSGVGVLDHTLVLLLTTVVAAGTAGLAYRNLRV